MSHTKNKSDSPRFQVGDKVRVKYGVIDPDFADMPLGGWTGTITEIIEQKGQIDCVLRLDDRTLKSLHPIYRKRCERDGLDFKTMWLGEEDIEPDDGTPVPIEQPTEIKTSPLSDKDQDDRVRLAQDRLVADREALTIESRQGDMAELSVFPDESFDLVFHPVSNVFVPDVKPVWREAYRVLRPGGTLLSGFMNPV
jgi:SAM-dependent methyltransferase